MSDSKQQRAPEVLDASLIESLGEKPALLLLASLPLPDLVSCAGTSHAVRAWASEVLLTCPLLSNNLTHSLRCVRSVHIEGSLLHAAARESASLKGFRLGQRWCDCSVWDFQLAGVLSFISAPRLLLQRRVFQSCVTS